MDGKKKGDGGCVKIWWTSVSVKNQYLYLYQLFEEQKGFSVPMN